jgi:hypothetical protein
MKSVSIFVAALAFGAGTFAMTRDAHALGPIGIEAGAKVGVASNPISAPSGESAPNPLNFGIGARAGVDILGFYGGLNFMYYFGASQDVTVNGATESGKYHTIMEGIELGYGISLLDILTIRPQIGIGNATFHYSVSGNIPLVGATSGGTNESNLYLEPGVTGLIGLGLWYVGADANILLLPGYHPGGDQDIGTKASISIHGQIGVKV